MKPRTLFGLCAAATLSWSIGARADGEDLAGLLDESVVTAASNTAETGRDAPATSTVITGESLRKYGARTLAEAMDMLALGTMSGRNAGGVEMGARGLTIAGSNGEHFLLLLDGARVNDFLHGNSPFEISNIPLEIVDHIEVILGPGSVLYGSNAMLGVVNVVTKDAKEFSGPRVGVESELLTSLRPWAGYGTSFDLAGVKGQATAEFEYYRRWGPSLYFQPIDGGIDPATGKPYRYTTAAVGTGVWGGGDSTRTVLAEASSLVGRVRLGRFELGYSAASSQGPIAGLPDAFDVPSSFVSRRLLLNLAYDNELSAMVRLKARAYVNASDSQTDIDVTTLPDCSDPTITCRLAVQGEGILRGIEITPSFDWLKNGTFVTLVGVDGAWRSGRSLVNEYNDATGAPVRVSLGRFDRTDAAGAAYVQQTWNPLPWLGINAGGRFDYDPRFSPVLSPRLAGRVDPWSGGTVKVIYSQAFRAPSFYESYFSHPLNPAPDHLRPEREQSFEASVEQRFSAHRLLFGGFATHWSDLIADYYFSSQEATQYVAQGKALVPPLYQYRNLASVQNWGFNTAFEGSQLARTLEYGVNLTAAIARLDNGQGDTTPLPTSPRIFGNVHVAYDLPGVLPTVALAASAQGERPVQDAFTSGFRPIPYVPAQLALHLTVSGPIPVLAGLSYRVMGFYSTTDHEPYRVRPDIGPSSQYTSPALVPIDRARVMVGLQYEFGP
jgi:outer membrane receptor for ferrienterochelin and colicins